MTVFSHDKRIMPCIPRRKSRRESGVVTGQAGIVVFHFQPSYIYIYIYIYICSSENGNPLLVDRKYVLILHKYFEISCSNSFISAVIKTQFYTIIILTPSFSMHVFSLPSRETTLKTVGFSFCRKLM